MTECPNCGAPLSSSTCEYCGASFAPKGESDSGKSAKSSSRAYPQDFVCVEDGPRRVYRVGNTIIASDKSKMAALLLCIFLGYFGAHYFYVGRPGMGILYLFTMGLFTIGWLVDIIRILCSSLRDKYGHKVMFW